MSKEPCQFDLEKRLIDFAVCIIRTVESLPKLKVGNHIGSQLIRSGTSPAANYSANQYKKKLFNSIFFVRYSIFVFQ